MKHKGIVVLPLALLLLASALSVTAFADTAETGISAQVRAEEEQP